MTGKMNMRFQPNDFVWAKVFGYSYWPALILKPHQNAPNKSHIDCKWVYFFWSHNYAWVREKYIKSYKEYEKKYTTKCSDYVLRAHREAKKHRRNMAKDPKYKIDFVEFTIKENRVRPKSSQSHRSVSSKASNTGRRPKSSQSHKSVKSKASSRTSITGRSMSRASSVSTFSSRAPSSYRGSKNQNPTYRTLLDVKKKRKVTKEMIGVLAGNLYGEAIAKNLIGFGHKVAVYSPSDALCRELKWFASTMGTYFIAHKTARDVVNDSRIIFSCSSNCRDAKDMLYTLGIHNKKDPLLEGKIFVEMTSVDSKTSYLREFSMNKKNAAYLEARIEGSVKNAEERDIILIVGGEGDRPKEIIDKYESCFWALGRAYVIVGRVGAAIMIHGLLQTIRSTILAGFAEATALANKLIKLDTFFEIFGQSALSCAYLNGICETISSEDYLTIQEPIGMLQDDLGQMLETLNKFRQPAPLASTANQLFKHARRLGFDDHDSAAMFLRAK